MAVVTIRTMVGTPDKSACFRWCRLRQTTELDKRVGGRIWLFEPQGLPCEIHVLKNHLLLQTHTHTHIHTTKALLAQAGGPVLPRPKGRFGLHTAASRVEIQITKVSVMQVGKSRALLLSAQPMPKLKKETVFSSDDVCFNDHSTYRIRPSYTAGKASRMIDNTS